MASGAKLFSLREFLTAQKLGFGTEVHTLTLIALPDS